MPTPVTTARQCLTPESAHALDEAVAVARRRAHAQTSSLHAISALLSLPSSPLRDACGRARNSAYTSRIQFKALELCLGVSLDRLPSSPKRAEEPPVSNSLMAAIKRSQANQRRQPENFQLYQQQQQLSTTSSSSSSSSSVSTVKVELQNLILSILDDPVVSRVFGEAGFRSCEIKLAIIRPVHQLLRYKAPPMFLCNLTSDSYPGHRPFSFPFPGFSGFLENDENSKRILEILVRKKGKNPVLVGVCANEALKNFLEMVLKRKVGVFPIELSGLSVIPIGYEILKFVTGNHNEGLLELRLEEVNKVVEQCIGPGVVINLGDFKILVDENASFDASGFIVRKIASLLEIHIGKVWIIGATARHETYVELLNRFPSIEKDWDLQLLPLTSFRPPMGETFPRSSLMESFVPFGGFFSTPSDMNSPLNGPNHCNSRCNLCNEKCKQELAALSEGGFTASVADQYQSSLPSWLLISEPLTSKELGASKAKDDSVVASAKVVGLQKKWDGICQHLHHAQTYTQMLPKAVFKIGSQVPAVVGFQVVEGRRENVGDGSINTTKSNASSTESGCEDPKSCKSMDLQPYTASKPIIQSAVTPKSMNPKFPSKLREKENPSTIDELSGLRCSPCSLSSSSVVDDRASPISVNSVTTDLGLGVNRSSMSREMEEPTVPAYYATRSSSSQDPAYSGLFNQQDFKMLYASMSIRIGRQEEALSIVCQTIARCRTKNDKRQCPSRGDIWFSFIGPDRIAKKKIAVVLAETLYGNRENIISVDLSLQNCMGLDQQQLNGFDIKLRGKNIIDFIADELRKRPLSVVFLENIDKADLLSQNHLSQAVMTGRFSDSHGREVNIGNTIFVTTFAGGLCPENEIANYSEENVLRAKGQPIQMFTGLDLGDDVLDRKPRVLHVPRKPRPNPICMNKRKLNGITETLEECQALEIAKRAHKTSNVYLDLNLPAEESETTDTYYDSVSENSKAWLEDFLKQMDDIAVFKPFDLDALAEKILNEISDYFQKIVGSEALLEIDSKVMEQILAAACLLENRAVEDWIDQVLSRAFAEARDKYALGSRSVVKLISYDGLLSEELPAVLLPARIIMN